MYIQGLKETIKALKIFKGGNYLRKYDIFLLCSTWNRGTVKLGFQKWLNKKKRGNREPFPETNMPVHLVNSEEIGFSEQLCDGQNVP